MCRFAAKKSHNLQQCSAWKNPNISSIDMFVSPHTSVLAGIQVWVRYVDDAIVNSMYHRKTGMSRPLIQLLAAKRKPLPYRWGSMCVVTLC